MPRHIALRLQTSRNVPFTRRHDTHDPEGNPPDKMINSPVEVKKLWPGNASKPITRQQLPKSSPSPSLVIRAREWILASAYVRTKVIIYTFIIETYDQNTSPTKRIAEDLQ